MTDHVMHTLPGAATEDRQAVIIAAAQQAITRVGENANPQWTKIARKAVLYVATMHHTFTSDDVWEAMSRWHPDVTTHENRAMGAVLVWAVRMKIAELQTCESCGTRKVTTPSRRLTSHGTDTAVYLSLVAGRRPMAAAS